MRAVRASLFVALICICVVLQSGCESDAKNVSLDNDNTDRTAPKVLEFTPRDREAKIENDQPLRILFSEEMNEDSLRESISLLQENEDSFGNVVETELDLTLELESVLVTDQDLLTGLPKSSRATRATLSTKNGRLPLDQNIAIKISESAKDSSTNMSNHPLTGDLVNGNFLENEAGISFETFGGEWKDSSVSRDFLQNGDIYQLRVIKSNSGQPMAIWAVDDTVASADSIFLSIYDEQTDAWQSLSGAVTPGFSSVPGAPATQGGILGLDTAVNAAGQVSVTWVQVSADTGAKAVYFNFYDGDSWLAEAITLSEAGSLDSGDPNVSQIGASRFLLAWSQNSASGKRIDFRVYDAELGSGALGGLSAVPGSEVSEISSLSLESYNDAAVLSWISKDTGAVFVLNSALFRQSTGWEFNGRVSPEYYAYSYLSGDVLEQFLYLNSDGDGYLVWTQLNNARRDVYRARIGNNLVSAAELAERDNSVEAFGGKIFLSDGGIAHQLWLVESGAATSVYASTLLDDGEDWSNPTLLGGQSGIQDILGGEFDAQGNFYAFWTVSGNRNSAQSRRYDFRSDLWGSGITIGTQSLLARDSQIKSIRSDGRMLLVQSVLSDGYYRLTHSLYDQVEN